MREGARIARHTRPGARHLVLPAGALVVAVALWWGLTLVAGIPSFLLPPPDAVAARLLGDPELYARNALFTLEKVTYGGMIGIAVGFVLALGVAYLPWFRRAIYPYLVTARVLPKIAIAPVLLIYLGTGTITAVVFVALIAFFPVALSTAAGLSKAPAGHHDLLESVNAGRIRRVLYVDLPYALPDAFAGLKQAVTLSVVGAVIAEWIAADNGLGFVILIASENVRTDVMLAALAVLILEGLALYGAVTLVQRATIHWSASE
ncbi:ABC transporter permease [Halalkalicoccus jeotgali]|uniref:Binding-protein-dependent transport systems inner membrane component n=1 Tax=Halalkalicoccus jeotgali (strain DSM 18796 / CECT 7217 / JCM 14584 / KCTC 4019 / B3) TaxID=795797 RepID=D8J9E7_HALJB|nr:ABC transporter permease [Halalkalicoccus jeotgali]ADJ14359.1 binding-protein-dependent transport systems inner membrane component [Halalkalicoccus jeotgali B3]ELY40620.1 binding-protein-dependent transport systems inner membrane component [Halalkalicoccus jeotgali B3]